MPLNHNRDACNAASPSDRRPSLPLISTQASETHPNIPKSSVDIVLLVDAYHEFSHPREVMIGVVEGLKPGGRVVLVEYRGEDRTVPN